MHNRRLIYDMNPLLSISESQNIYLRHDVLAHSPEAIYDMSYASRQEVSHQRGASPKTKKNDSERPMLEGRQTTVRTSRTSRKPHQFILCKNIILKSNMATYVCVFKIKKLANSCDIPMLKKTI